MIALLLGTAWFLVFLEVLIIVRSFRYARRERRCRRGVFAPKAVILAPHYGWDEETEQNARLLLEQDYPGDYEVLFVTHAHDGGGADPSFGHLERLSKEHRRARVLLAPNIVDNALSRSQKVQNLLTAIGEVGEDVEILAFVDADSRVRRDWLRCLVQPLQDGRVGATVGGRFYVPRSLNMASLVEAVWVNFQLFWQGDHSHAMVWGGSAAVRRDLIRRGDVARRWNNATFEDHALTRAVYDLGLKVHFVPACIVVTETAKRTWRQVFEFTNRQILVTYRMGHKAQWAMIIGMFLPKALIVPALIPILGMSLERLLPLLLIPATEAAAYMLAALMLPGWLLREPGVRLSIVLSSFLAPLSMLVAVVNSINALFRSEIVWGGVRYVCPSATECHVLGREAGES